VTVERCLLSFVPAFAAVIDGYAAAACEILLRRSGEFPLILW
jgi:hypothetical protein